jgi:hypothetical protein
MMKQTILFVRDAGGLEQLMRSAKNSCCAHCGRRGTLNRHDRPKGNDPAASNKQRVRGQRLWCSNRGRRGGCGQTIYLAFAWVLPRHTFTAPMLKKLLSALRAGSSVQVAWGGGGLSLALQSSYHLLQRFRERIGELRSCLSHRGPPPQGMHPDPLVQTIEHLSCAFASEDCPIAAFQCWFQTPIMG